MTELKKKYNKSFIFFVIIVFIVPVLTFILTIYTISLKNKIKDLKLSINDLRSEVVLDSIQSTPTENMHAVPSYSLTEPNVPKINYELKDVNYYNLLSVASMSIESQSGGHARTMEEKEAYLQAVQAYKREIPFMISKNGDEYVLYSKEFTNNDLNSIYSIQLATYSNIEGAYVACNLLRKEGVAAYVYKGYYAQSGKEYHALMLGIFTSRKSADTVNASLDLDRTYKIIGVDVKGRYIRLMDFEPRT